MNWVMLFGVLALFFIFGIGLAALIVVLNVVFSRFITRARTTVEQMPIRSGLVGFINFAFFGILAIALWSVGHVSETTSGVLRFISALIVLVLMTFIVFGMTAIARWVGERLAPNLSATRQTLSGIVALELAALTPLVGWIFVPLAVVFAGYGAVIIALVWRRTPTQPQSPVSNL